MTVYIGLDIGGTKFMAAAADGEGELIRRARADTPLGLDEGLDLLQQLVTDVSDGDPIRAIGAAIGGPLDWRRGVVSPLHQPAWRDVPLKAIMEDAFGCPFHVDVDTNVAALGEYRAWQEPPSRLLYITLSIGMGGGFVIDGRIYRGMGEGHPNRRSE